MQGKFSFKDSKGNTVTIGGSRNLNDVPSWVPRPPDMTGNASIFNGVHNGKAGGIYTVSSTKAAEDLDTYFKDEAAKLGLDSSSHVSGNLNGALKHSASYSNSSYEFSVVIAGQEGSPLNVQITYQEK